MTTVQLLCIGDELLDGRVRDANTVHLAGVAALAGVPLVESRVVPDDFQAIRWALSETTAEVVVVSGGLGPTADDITRDAAAAFAGAELVVDEPLLQELKEAFHRRGYPFTENNRRQCAFPAGAQVLPTEVGTAAGFRLHHQGREFYFLPGVPSEFRWFLDHHLLAGPLASQVPTGSTRLVFFGLGESDLETRIGTAAEEARDLGVTLGYRAHRSLIEVSLKGPQEARRSVEATIKGLIGSRLVAEGDQSFSERVAHALLNAGLTVTVAESCTGGLLGARLTDVPGSSGYFHAGYLTYSNQAKIDLLGVSEETLKAHGAVSPEVVSEMARGARQRSGADLALAVSGIAGPGGGTPEKPVGTVYFGFATPAGTYTLRRHFGGRSRGHVRTLSVHTALSLLLFHLEGRLDLPELQFSPSENRSTTS